DLHRAHWATTALSWGPSEHRDHTSYLALTFGGRALHEHRRSSGSIPSSLPRFFPIPLQRVGWSILYERVERYKCSFHARSYPLQGWGLIDPLLRALNEHIL